MTVRKIVLATALLVFTVSLSFVQEKQQAEDILRWFPKDIYEDIYHFDRIALKKAENYEKNKDFGFSSASLTESKVPLPDTLKLNYESVTAAKKVRLRVYKKSGRPRKKRDNESWIQIGNAVYVARITGEWLGVYRFKDLDPLIKDNVQKGILAPTSDSFFKRSIYKCTSRYPARKTTFFLYPSSFQELLVCSDVSLLKRMIVAGHGEEDSFLDEQRYVGVRNLIFANAHSWNWRSFTESNLAILAKASEFGRNQELAKNNLEFLEQDLQWLLQCYILEDDPVFREIRYFGSEERARIQYDFDSNPLNQNLQGLSPGDVIYQEAKKYQLDGHYVITTTTFTEELKANAAKADEEYESGKKRKKPESKAKKRGEK